MNKLLLLFVLLFCSQVYSETCNLHEVIENIYEITQEARRRPDEPEETWLPSIKRQIKSISCPDIQTYLSLDLFTDIANIVRNMCYLKWNLYINVMDKFAKYMFPAVDGIVENALKSANAVDEALMFNFDSFDLKQLILTGYEVAKYLTHFTPPIAVPIFISACLVIFRHLDQVLRNGLGLSFLFR